jgi:hypothetical protein
MDDEFFRIKLRIEMTLHLVILRLENKIFNTILIDLA